MSKMITASELFEAGRYETSSRSVNFINRVLPFDIQIWVNRKLSLLFPGLAYTMHVQAIPHINSHHSSPAYTTEQFSKFYSGAQTAGRPILQEL